jgi:DNA-binding response OmpR family regulator
VRYGQAVAHEPASSIWSVNGSRILLVEDDEDIGSELIQALISHGYRARLACGGTEALSAAAAEAPDLVLLDLGLPDIVAGIAVLGLVAAALATIRAARRPPLTILREL